MALEQEQESEHLQSRTESMRKIETILNEVATIFTRLGTIVKMHEVLIERLSSLLFQEDNLPNFCVRIDKNTEETLVNVQKGKKNLLQVYDDVSGWRKTILTVK
jgi:syntaxin 5